MENIILQTFKIQAINKLLLLLLIYNWQVIISMERNCDHLGEKFIYNLRYSLLHSHKVKTISVQWKSTKFHFSSQLSSQMCLIRWIVSISMIYHIWQVYVSILGNVSSFQGCASSSLAPVKFAIMCLSLFFFFYSYRENISNSSLIPRISFRISFEHYKPISLCHWALSPDI